MISVFKKIILKIIGKRNLPADHRDKYLDLIELSYLFSMFNLFNKVKDVPGHIIELGVGAGRNAIFLGNLIKTLNLNENCKYFGFDTFESYTDKDLYEHKYLSRTKWKNNSYSLVHDRLKRHNLLGSCMLVKGDIRQTLPDFITGPSIKKSDGELNCRLVYIDTSAYVPAKLGFEILWEHVVPGGVIAIDQRTHGGEWKAILEFCKSKGIEMCTGQNFNDTPIFIVKK